MTVSDEVADAFLVLGMRDPERSALVAKVRALEEDKRDLQVAVRLLAADVDERRTEHLACVELCERQATKLDQAVELLRWLERQCAGQQCAKDIAEFFQPKVPG